MRESASAPRRNHTAALADRVSPLYMELETAAALTTLSPATIQNLVVEGKFPAPRELSGRRVGFLLREVIEWAENRPVSNLPPPPNTGAKKPKRKVDEPPVVPDSQTGA